MDRMNAITWFEIPASDLARATQFYEKVLGRALKRETMGETEFSMFPADEHAVSGCVIAGEGHTPSTHGQLVYLNATPSLDEALKRVTAAGGQVALAKTALPEGMGFFAHIVDSEGNRVGLHAMA